MPNIKRSSKHANADAPAELDFSIIIPLENNRTHWYESIASWSRRQTHPRSRYEVIVVSSRDNSALEDEVRKLLLSHDSIVRCPSTNEYMLYDFAARQAKGQFLFFTEAHCVGADDCLAELSNFLSTRDLAGALCNYQGAWDSYIGELVARLMHDETVASLTDGIWSRISVTGTAIRRDIYLEHGGLPYKYQLFSDRAFEIRLHEQNLHIGLAEKAILSHYVENSWRQIAKHYRSYTFGEHTYRSDFPEHYWQKYLGDSGEWLDRHFCIPSVAESRYAVLLKFVLNNIKHPANQSVVRAALPSLLESWLIKHLGGTWLLLEPRLTLTQAILKIWWWHFFDKQRSYTAYRKLILSDFVHYFRLQCALQEKTESHRNHRLDFDLNEDLGDHLVGFHALECTEQGRCYKFTKRVSMLRVSMPAAQYRVDIEVIPCRPADLEPHLMAFFDGRKLETCAYFSNPNTVSFLIEQEYFAPQQRVHHLALVCHPFRPSEHGSEDIRELGVAIASIRFQPDDRDRLHAGMKHVELHSI